MSYDQSDLAIPELKLIQNVGGDEAKQAGAQPGNFYFPMTQEIIKGMEGLDIVIIAPIQKTRTYWGREELDDEPPTCASLDGTVSVNGDDCKTACPFQAYTDAPAMLSPQERRLKCTSGYNILCIKLGDMMPMLIRCTGISAMAARELLTVLTFHKGIKGQTYKAKLHVSAIKKKTSSGEAYAIKFGAPELIIDPEILSEVRETAAMIGPVEMIQIEAAKNPELGTGVPEPVKEVVKPAVQEQEQELAF